MIISCPAPTVPQKCEITKAIISKNTSPHSPNGHSQPESADAEVSNGGQAGRMNIGREICARDAIASEMATTKERGLIPFRKTGPHSFQWVGAFS